MGFRNWLTKNASKTAETVIVKTKENLQKNVEVNVVKKGNAMFTIGKLVLLGVIFALTFKDNEVHIPDHLEPAAKIPNITINNYMNERSKDNG